ncbi:MAG: hypothetical protein AAF635_14575 [Cyanobacteria bacterium P01_C01_bin.69]
MFVRSTLTGRLMHRLSDEPMITIPFSYCVGGSLSWNDSTYVKRAADDELYSAIEQRAFSYVFGPRQIGKSSLRIRMRHRLTQQGYRCVSLQANQLCSPSKALRFPSASFSQKRQPQALTDQPLDPQEQGVSTLIAALWADLNLAQIAPLRPWLEATASLSPQVRLERFGNDFLVDKLLKTPVVVFIDEVDALLGIPFLASLLQWIGCCDRLRQTEAAYNNLTFVLLGTTTSADLVQSVSALPAASQTTATNGVVTQSLEEKTFDLFTSGCQICIKPFQLIETFSLHQGFEEKIDDPTMPLKAIFRWTHGQPFLTQKICHIASNLIDTLVRPSSQPIVLSSKIVNSWMDSLVRSHIIKNWPTQDTPVHLRAIRDRLIYSPNSKSLLALYKAIYAGNPVLVDGSSLQAELLLTGIVDIVDDHLKITNRIYREVFSIKSPI